MTFRPPLRKRWAFPLVMCGLVALLYGVISMLWQANPRNVRDYLVGLAILVLAVYVCAGLSWYVWTSRVVADNHGVHWKAGKERGALKWEEISGLARQGEDLALVVRATGKVRPLPFVTERLYRFLAQRLNPLSPNEEGFLLRREGFGVRRKTP